MSGLGRGALALLAPILAALAIGAAAPSNANAVVYWGSGSVIGAANTDGTMLLDSYPYGLANTIPEASVCGVAVNAGRLFWADQSNGTVGTMELSNTPNGRIEFVKEPMVSIDQAFIPGLQNPCGIAVDGQHIYWASRDRSSGTGAIGRAAIDGNGVERDFIGGLSYPCGVAIDAQHIYWGDLSQDSIGRASLQGTEVEPEFISGAINPCGVAVDSTHVYWTSEEPDSIGRAAIDGSEVEPDFIPLTGRPCGVAVDAAHVYWADRFEPGTYVSRANLDGTDPQLLAGEQFYEASCGVALDSRTFSPPPPPPSPPVRFGPVKRLKRGRLLVLPVYVAERGNLWVNSPHLGWSVDKGPEPPPYRGGIFRWKLRLWPGQERTGRRIRERLRKTGKATINLVVSYEETGRTPTSTSKQIAFRAR